MLISVGQIKNSGMEMAVQPGHVPTATGSKVPTGLTEGLWAPHRGVSRCSLAPSSAASALHL